MLIELLWTRMNGRLFENITVFFPHTRTNPPTPSKERERGERGVPGHRILTLAVRSCHPCREVRNQEGMRDRERGRELKRIERGRGVFTVKKKNSDPICQTV